MTYSPRPVPASIERDAQTYLADEFRKVRDALDVVDAVTFQERNAAPAKISDGMVLYADGSNWNPGDGQGLYARVNGAWESLVGLQRDENETISGNWTFDGHVTIGTGDHDAGDSILTFAVDRTWEIKQYLSDASSVLGLHSNNNLKRFWLTNASDGVSFAFAPDATLPYFRIYDGASTDYINMSLGTSDFTIEGASAADLELIGFTGALDLRDGMDLRIRDAGDTDWVNMNHDGTDFNISPVNTVDINIDSGQAMTGQLKIFVDTHLVSGSALQIRDSTNNDSCTWSHDGTNLDTDFVNTTWNYVTGLTGRLYRDGAQSRWYDAANNDSIRIYHDGTWGQINHGNVDGGQGTRIVGGSLTNRSGVALFTLSASDDATTSITLPHGGGIMLMCTSTTTATASIDAQIIFWASTSTATSIWSASPAALSLGTGSNPDVDGDTNIWWTNSGTTLNIKNRRGGFRYYNILIVGGDQ